MRTLNLKLFAATIAASITALTAVRLGLKRLPDGRPLLRMPRTADRASKAHCNSRAPN